MTTHLAAIGAVRIKPWVAPLFYLHAGRALKAARHAKGCIYAGTRLHEGKAFSLSVWDSPADMKAYAMGSVHKTAVNWAWLTATTLRFCHFPTDGRPSWDEAIERWDKMMRAQPLVPPSELGQKRAFK